MIKNKNIKLSSTVCGVIFVVYSQKLYGMTPRDLGFGMSL